MRSLYITGCDVLGADVTIPLPQQTVTVPTVLPAQTTPDGKTTIVPVILPVENGRPFGEPLWQVVFDLFTAVAGGYILWKITQHEHESSK